MGDVGKETEITGLVYGKTGDRNRADSEQRGSDLVERTRGIDMRNKRPICLFKYTIVNGKYLCGGRDYSTFEEMLYSIEGAAD